MRRYEKGQEVEAVVLAIDPERERISLGVKQLEQDPLAVFLAANTKGSRVKGVVAEVDVRGASVQLESGATGYVRASELSRERVEDARQVLSEGDDIEAQFVGVDRKNRTVSLSVKGREIAEEKEAVQEYSSRSAASGTTSLGDILKEQMESSREDSQ
jgi:small subunit ribosomal protein S1